MTAYGNCYQCGLETGIYDSEAKRWDCGCSTRKPEPMKPKIAPKYAKLLRTGRWELIEKTDGHGMLHPVGVRRLSTGEERWF